MTGKFLRVGGMAVAAAFAAALGTTGSARTPVPDGQAAKAKVDVLDVHRLPLGDGRVSATPAQGSVMSCLTRFRPGGPTHAGAWIQTDTWDLTAKPAVRGEVVWPNAILAITTTTVGRVVSRMVAGNGLPVGTSTGEFPIGLDDPARQFDPNPNAIAPQDILLTLPRDPVQASSASCVPMGMIGVALNGVAIYNALDASGRDAVAHEVQDLCSGHPQMRGEYHYHGPSPCLPDQTAIETLIGYALDGFGIYSMYDAHGRELTNADLDDCHGRVSEVDWNGGRASVYHYVLTREYPYTVGCFRGTPAREGPGR